MISPIASVIPHPFYYLVRFSHLFLAGGTLRFNLVVVGETYASGEYNGYYLLPNKWIRLRIIRRYQQSNKTPYSIFIFLVDHTGKLHRLFAKSLKYASQFGQVPLYSGTQAGRIRNLHVNGKNFIANFNFKVKIRKQKIQDLNAIHNGPTHLRKLKLW